MLFNHAHFSSLTPTNFITVLDPRLKEGIFTSHRNRHLFSANWYRGCHERLITALDEFRANTASSDPPLPLAAPTFVQPHRAFRFADPSVIGMPCRQAVVTANDSWSELARYLEEDLLEHNRDPLEYWRINSTRFPTLARMAQTYLTIPGEIGSLTGRP